MTIRNDMKPCGAGVVSIGIGVPREIRENTFWTENYPRVVELLERRAVDPLRPSFPPTALERASAHSLTDPFRGGVQRRALAPGQTVRDIEVEAAMSALAAAELDPDDIDLLISCAFVPDYEAQGTWGIGNAVFLCQALGIECAAWNLETACSGALIAIQNACALIAAGQHGRVLIVVSCNYAQRVALTSPVSTMFGDAATAFVVGRTEGAGHIDGVCRNTAQTIGGVRWDVTSGDAGYQLEIRSDVKKARKIWEASEPMLKACTQALFTRTGVTPSELDFMICNTPAAYYHEFAADVVGIASDKVNSTHHLYGNIGPALLGMNAYHATWEGKVKAGDLVLLYTVGSVSSAAASLVRWGDVSVGVPSTPLARTSDVSTFAERALGLI